MNEQHFRSITRSFFFAISLTGLLLVVFPAAAQIGTIAPGQCTGLGITCNGTLLQYVYKVMNYLLGFISFIAVVFIVYAGVKYITSAGDEKKAETAKMQIIYAVIGLIVVGLSAVVVNFAIKISQ